MQTQISRAISCAISERILPEIQNMVENLPLNRHGVEPRTSSNENGIGNVWKNKNAKFTKKDSRSAFDLREDTEFTSYTRPHKSLLWASELGLEVNSNYKIAQSRMFHFNQVQIAVWRKFHVQIGSPTKLPPNTTTHTNNLLARQKYMSYSNCRNLESSWLSVMKLETDNMF